MHLNMANMLVDKRLNDEKESFVRTVATARQECKQFNDTIRKKDEGAAERSAGVHKGYDSVDQNMMQSSFEESKALQPSGMMT